MTSRKLQLRYGGTDLPARLRTFTYGLIFGYPECCILEFDAWRQCAGSLTWGVLVARAQTQLGEPWGASGFIPCEACAPEARADFDAFVRKHIYPRRMVMNGLWEDTTPPEF